MKKIYTFLLLSMVLIGSFALCIMRLHMDEGVNFVTERTDTEAVRRGNDSPDTQFLYLLPGETLNINTAPVAQLKRLPGIGDVLSEAIAEYREKNGNFERIEDIMLIDGIGKGTFEAIKEFIRLDDGLQGA